jgi:hypothetical protein
MEEWEKSSSVLNSKQDKKQEREVVEYGFKF